MSDVYSFDPEDPIDFLNRRAQAQAAMALDKSPDDAARALELSKVSNIPAPLIAEDTKRYEAQVKSDMASGIIARNNYIRDYLNAQPLAAQASADDYGNLDATSVALKMIPDTSVLRAFGRGFSEGFDAEGLMTEYSKLYNFVDSPAWRAFVGYTGFGNLALAAGASLHAFTGALYGVGEAGGEVARSVGATGATSARFTRDIIQIGQVALSGQTGIPVAPELQAAARASQKAQPYIREGKTPPVGLDPILDEAHKQQVKTDMDSIAEALKESVKSSTRERANELFEEFTKLHTGNQEFGLPADIVRLVYGEKEWKPDDGILGWIPNLEQQMAVAAKTGGDVKIPASTFFAKMEPEVFQQIKDFIRPREGGLTLDEVARGIEVYHGSPHEFEAFDIGKAGTGEGAQSYGFGHYFAENPEVAKSYGTAGKMRPMPYKYTVNGKEVSADGVGTYDNAATVETAAAFRMHRASDDRAVAIAAQERRVANAKGEDVNPAFDKEVLEVLKSGDIQNVPEPTGNLYRTRILRRPEEFLDYDKPLDQQPELFNKIAAHDILGDVKTQGDLSVENFLASASMHLEDIGSYKDLSTKPGGPGMVMDQANRDVSRMLGEAGIAGIKYLDQFSRAGRLEYHVDQLEGQWVTRGSDGVVYAGPFPDEAAAKAWVESKKVDKETRNFVVFRDADIEVLERNGEALRSLREASGLQPKGVTPPEPTAAPEPGIKYAKPTVAPDITKALWEKYAKTIAQQRADDLDYIVKKAERDAKRRQTKEWKENEIAVRAETVDEMRREPIAIANALLRDGRLGDTQVPKPKLGAEFLTPEQVKALPKQWVSESGIRPDEVAAMTGYKTGTDLVNALVAYETARNTAKMGPMAFSRRLVDAAVERKMEERYGVLKDNIFEDAKAQILTELEETKLGYEAIDLALQSGLDYEKARFELERGRQAAIEAFENSLVRDVSSDDYMATVGRRDRLAEQALLKDDNATALTNRENKYIAAVLGRRALEVEGIVADVTKLSARYAGRDLPKVARDTVNYVRWLLSEAGLKLKVTPAEIQRAIAQEGYSSFQHYVASKDAYGYEPEVSARIAETGPGKLDEMTVAQFREFADAIESLDKIGRKENSVNIAGQKMDFADWKAKVRENLEQRPIRDEAEAAAGGKWLYGLEAPLTRIEEIAKDIDLRKELGPFYEAVIVPFEQAKADHMNRAEKLSKQTAAFGKEFDWEWRKKLDDKIPNDFIRDPWYGGNFELTRWNMLKLMMNLGNDSNARVLIDGIAKAWQGSKEKPPPELTEFIKYKLDELINTHATAQDWKFVQKLWDTFAQYEDDIYRLTYATGGKEVKFIQPREIVNQHGTFRGGYFPLIPDKNRNLNFTPLKAMNIDGPLGPDFFRATTRQDHLQARTGASYFVDISNGPEQIFGRLQQVIFDLAYREFAIDSGKVIYDPEINNLIKKHYGVEYQTQLEPWFKRTLNQMNAPERELATWNKVGRQVRMNLMVYALPLNYAVMFSPSMATANPWSIMKFNAQRGENVKLVMEQSKELQHTMYSMDRDVQEALNRSLARGKYTTYQLQAAEFIFKPLVWAEQQFRMVTFYDKFMEAKSQGRTDAQASILADSLVRERHGVGAVGDLPMLMSNPNEWIKMSTMFLGYFTMMRNWTRQIPHHVREGNMGEIAKIMWSVYGVNTLLNAAFFERRKKDDTFFSFMGRAMMSTPLMMFPYVRDLYTYYSQGYRPTPSILSAALAVGEVMKDGYKAYTDEKPLKHVVRDIAAVAGQVGGVPGMLQVGRTGQFLYDLAAGKQEPEDMVEWIRGVLTGKAKLER